MIDFWSFNVTRFLEILLLNLVLSGDNALVIAASTLRLNKEHRRRAIACGTALSVLLRLVLTVEIGKLLTRPYIQAVGGALLVYLAWSLLSQSQKYEHALRVPGRLTTAVLTIVFADLTMSFDNVIAMAGVAENERGLLVLGVVLSAVMIMVASNRMAQFLLQHRSLNYLGAAVLAFTAGKMEAHDPALRALSAVSPYAPAAAFVVLVGCGYFVTRLAASVSG